MFAAASKTASSSAPSYIEDVFSTYLYTGNSAARSITNGIDLSTKGGMVWIKSRPSTTDPHVLTDTARGATKYIASSSTAAQVTNAQTLTAFNTDGFSLGTNGSVNQGSTTDYVSWTFRKQPKFFDVVTFTMPASSNSNFRVSHNLGSVPGCIMVKALNLVDDWYVWHRSLASSVNDYMRLNWNAAYSSYTNIWGTSGPTATDFGVNTALFGLNQQYVAYIFAHNAGGFGSAGTDNVISCGSYVGTGATGNNITLGYEPQFVMVKASSGTGNWVILDNMRGFPESVDKELYANTTGAETNSSDGAPTATGFRMDATGSPNTSGVTYIYIAIRRGPMKTPTSGTSVFSPNTFNSVGAGTAVTTGFPIDTQIAAIRGGGATVASFYDRLRGVYTLTGADGSGAYLRSSSTAAETAGATQTRYWNSTGFQVASFWTGNPVISWNLRRAPGFFDVVCYTGTGTSLNPNHNLGVAPELKIIKNRSAAGYGWPVGGNVVTGGTKDKYLFLNTTAASVTSASYWDSGFDTATTFSTRTNNANTNSAGDNYVAYLFASCPGVSKVGSYSGTGGTQTISCGFAARFVMIKRTDSTGDWWVWDTARGMVAGTDPRLAYNLNDAETNANWVYTDASGFQIVTTDASVNASGGTYIYLAIA